LNPFEKTFDAQYMATSISIAATNDAKGASCPKGYDLDITSKMPYEVRPIFNSHWLEFTCSPEAENQSDIWTPGAVDYGKRYTQVMNADLSLAWTIPYRGFPWSYRPGAFLDPYRLSSDGIYLYFVPLFIPGGDGWYSPGYFYNDSVLYRLNLHTGDFKVVLPYTKIDGYAFSLSPNDQYLAYRNPNEENIVHINDLINGNDTQVKLDGTYELTGAFVWTSDSKQVFFASAKPGWLDGKAGISIFMLNINKMELHTKLFNDRRLLIPSFCSEEQNFSSWVDGDKLCVRSLDYMSEAYFSDLLLNINTGNLIVIATPKPGLAITATPTP